MTIKKLYKKYYRKKKAIRPRKSSRNFDDPQYKAWRKSVYQRDDYTCQMCHKAKKRLQAHHILMWSKYPQQRYNIANGITLCLKCHKLVRNKEDYYVKQFLSIVSSKNV